MTGLLCVCVPSSCWGNNNHGQTGLVSVSFPPLLTVVSVGNVEFFKWAAIGGQFFIREGSK